MKLLTLNTHSLIEENYPQKLDDFVGAIAEVRPDIIALQEVNQTVDASAVEHADLCGYTPCCENAVIRANNHVYNAVKQFAERGVHYHWTWLPVKNGYGIFDEGLALMSLSPIAEVDALTVSGVNAYTNWKTRKLVGISTQNAPDEWFFSVHYGWWGDADEPFETQWQRTDAHMARYERVWLMGDFNCPAHLLNEGYDLVARSGWLDSYALAAQKDGGITVGAPIDGWRDKPDRADGMRIDQIWVSHPVKVKSSQVIFNGEDYPIISDHYGLLVETERSAT